MILNSALRAFHTRIEPLSPSYVDSNTIRRLTPMSALIAALRTAFADRPTTSPRQTLALPHGGTMMVMPAWHPSGSSGVKIVTVYPDARPAVRATYLLLDGESGAPLAVLDGTMLTARRTGAASALACDYLARSDARCLLMLGTGVLVPHLVEAHCAVRPIDRVLIWGRDAIKAQAMAKQLGNSGINAEPCATIEKGLTEADIVSAATLSTTALIQGAYVRPGTHIDLVGAFRHGMSEADPECFRRARVFVDTREGTLEEAGDLLDAVAAGAMTAAAIEADLADLCAEGYQRRRGGHEITLFKSVGASIEDLIAAEMVVRSLDRVA